MPFLLYTLVGLAVCFVVWKLFRPGDPVVTFDPDDPRVLEVEAEAQRTFSLFAKHILADGRSPAGEAGVKVKIPLNDGVGGSESIWLFDPEISVDGGYVGTIHNAPQFLEDVRMGEKMVFEPDQVVDWQFVEKSGKIFGHFVTRLMLEHGPPPRRARSITDNLASEPLPSSWDGN